MMLLKRRSKLSVEERTSVPLIAGVRCMEELFFKVSGHMLDMYNDKEHCLLGGSHHMC